MTKTMTSREFNQDTGAAKKFANNGPVVITDRGQPAHVLITIEEYRRLVGGRSNIVDLLAMPGAEDIQFDPARADKLHRDVDLA